MNPAAVRRKLEQAREHYSEERFAEAFRLLRELTRICPGSPEIWLEFAAAAGALRRADQAELARRRVRELAPRDSRVLLQLGHQYQAARQPDLARECFLQAAEADPRDVNPVICVAALLERNHQFAEARACVEGCLALEPGEEQAEYLSALLDRREDDLAGAERRLRRLIAAPPRHPYVSYASHYELAQILDRTGCPDEAMSELARAKELVRRLADIEEVAGVFDAMVTSTRRVWKQPTSALRRWAKFFPEKERQPAAGLAFLGGHPRSGTTLMEQILGAHPQIAPLDEPHLFASVLLRGLRRLRPLSIPRLRLLRRRYVREFRREFGPGAEGKFLLEKNPSLTSALPVWLRVFPDLRVIIALRDPRDVVLSCYFQNLPLNVANANFLTLERTARHYAALMDVWLAVRRWEGFAWIETRYEDTVADPEREGRRVTEFLGLGWHERQARFYEHGRRVFSPTYHDVSRPIHRRSVARWQAYEKHLAPILPLLEPYCRAFGYS